MLILTLLFISFTFAQSDVSEECDLCIYVVQYVEDFLKDNKTEQVIEADVGRVCGLLSKPYDDMCRNIDNEYIPVIINFLVEEEPPKKVCEQINFCKSEVVIPKESGTCEICEYVASFLEKWIAENKTETEMEDLLGHACALLPDPYKNMCDQIEREYLPYLINLLEEEFPPKKVCELLTLCSKKREEPSNDMCKSCKTVVQFVEGWLAENKTEPEIEHFLSEYCKLLPSPYGDECKTILDEYLPMIIEYIEDYTPEEICELLELCSSRKGKPGGRPENNGRPKTSVFATDNCFNCKMVIMYIEEWLKDNSTVTSIEEKIEHMCNILPSAMQEPCDRLIEGWVPELVDWIEEFTPEEVCDKIGICNATSTSTATWKNSDSDEKKKKKKENNNNDGRVEIIIVVDDDDDETQEKKKKMKKNYKNLKTDNCFNCKMVIMYVEEWLKDNNTVTQIEEKIEILCNILPSSFEEPCDRLVEGFVPDIVEWIEEFTPDEVCEMINMCNKTSTMVEKKKKKNKFKIPFNDGCSNCKSIVTFIDGWLEENATIPEIEQYVEMLCSLLESYEQECNDIVEAGIPEICDWIEKFSPEEVCEKLGICTSLKELKKFWKDGKKNKEENSDEDACSLCKMVVGYVDQWLEQNKTEEEIEQGLDDLCKLLPPTYRSSCENLVQEYLPIIIEYVEEFEPEDVCKMIKFCTTYEEEEEEEEKEEREENDNGREAPETRRGDILFEKEDMKRGLGELKKKLRKDSRKRTSSTRTSRAMKTLI